MTAKKKSSTFNRKMEKQNTSGTKWGWYLHMIVVFNLITSHIQTVHSFQRTKNTLQKFKEVELEEYLPNEHDGSTSFERVHNLGNTDFDQSHHDQHTCDELFHVIDVDSEHSGRPRSEDAFSICENLLLDKKSTFPIMKLGEGSSPFNAVVSDHSRTASAGIIRYGEGAAPESLRYAEASHTNSMFTHHISEGMLFQYAHHLFVHPMDYTHMQIVPRAKSRKCLSNCYDFLSGRKEDQESHRALAELLLSGKESHVSSFQNSIKKSKVVVPRCLYHPTVREPPDMWKTSDWISFAKALETYINGNRKEREHATMSILRYTMRLPLDSSQIDALCHIFDQLFKGGELSLFDKAHLAFSLHSYGSFYSRSIRQEDHEKIYQLAQLLEQHCRSDPESLVAVWNGSISEEDQVVRDLLDPMLSLIQAKFDDVVKITALRSRWIYTHITSEGSHRTESDLRDAEPISIEKKLEKIRVILEEYTDWNHVSPPTTWDMLYLMKTLYILQTHVKQKMESFKGHMAEGLSDQVRSQWDSVVSVLVRCKQLISKAELPMPPKNIEMRKAYSEILNSQVQEEGLNKYRWGEGSQNMFLRMASHQQLIPEKGTTQGLSILMQFMSSITKPKTLIRVIQDLGKDSSVITDITKHEDNFYHNKILRLLQWLSMKHYVDDKVDFLIKKQIIKKAIEVHREIGNSESRDLVFALIGRLLSLHPTDEELLKLAKFNYVWNGLQVQDLSRDFAPPKVKMTPITLARQFYKYFYED